MLSAGRRNCTYPSRMRFNLKWAYNLEDKKTFFLWTPLSVQSSIVVHLEQQNRVIVNLSCCKVMHINFFTLAKVIFCAFEAFVYYFYLWFFYAVSSFESIRLGISSDFGLRSVTFCNCQLFNEVAKRSENWRHRPLHFNEFSFSA